SINHFRPALLNAISTLDTRCDTSYQERRFGTSSPPRTADTATPFAGGRFTMSDAHPTPSAKPSKPDPDFGNAEGAVTDGGLRLAGPVGVPLVARPDGAEGPGLLVERHGEVRPPRLMIGPCETLRH